MPITTNLNIGPGIVWTGSSFISDTQLQNAVQTAQQALQEHLTQMELKEEDAEERTKLTTEQKTVAQMFELSSSYTGSTDFLAGVEYEIEGIHSRVSDDLWDHGHWLITDDPSLRNNGKEIITHPASFDTHLKWFKGIHEGLFFKPSADPYTERTSTHVHVNFKPVTMKKLAQFVKLYVLFEPYFFHLVKPNRINNIYCVPLYYTVLPRYYSNAITYQLTKWHKYTAFNLLPLRDKGTIEFRHLHGTGDINEFKRWLATIKSMYEFNLLYNLDFNGPVLNDIGQLFKNVFGVSASEVGFNLEQLDETVLDVKLSVAKFNCNALNGRIRALTKE